MTIKHVLLELLCSKNSNEDGVPAYCRNGFGEPGYHCLENNCKHVSFTYAPHEIAYSAEYGEVPDSDAWIGFGGEMVPQDIGDTKITEFKKFGKRYVGKRLMRPMMNILGEQVSRNEFLTLKG
ncbi:hypothetical protein EV586_1076 [Tumebacillus sp. BK434]|uniref:hypothetical protein n=1 Tax=Tumebacillus sp. BK434 TaxID=2512169 RepID=UPI0010F3489E|nr:hypothetical protein [Tumebacillus sp. BK434]TCP52763.1 hypothetical protein EV586_1076 [Tumebacillus sp. BK434]